MVYHQGQSIAIDHAKLKTMKLLSNSFDAFPIQNVFYVDFSLKTFYY